MKTKTRTIPGSFKFYVTLLTSISIIALGVFLLYMQYQNLEKDIIREKEEYILKQKQLVQNETEKITEYIRISKMFMYDDLKKELEYRVTQAHGIAQNLFEKNKDHLSKKQILDLVREALRPIRFKDDNSHLFMMSLDGKEVLYPVHPNLEGTNLLQLKNSKEESLARKEIHLATTSGEGFIEGSWAKPSAPGKNIPTVTYIKLFAPLNIIIGSGEFVDDAEKKLQEKIIKHIEQVRYGKKGYIFLNSYDGKAIIISSNKHKRGDDIWELTDPYGVKVIQEERKAASNPEGGFITYHWQEPNMDQPISKIAFIKGIPEWKWMVGAWYHFDEIDASIARQRKELTQRMWFQAIQISIMLIFSYLLIFLVTRNMARKMKKTTNIFISLLGKAIQQNKKIDTGKLHYDEFKEMSEAANHIIQEKEKVHQALVETAEKLQEANQTKDKFISIIAHDLKNPFNALLGFSSLLRDQYDDFNDEIRKDFIMEINRSAEQNLKLLENLLEWARAQTNRMKNDPQQNSLFDTVEECRQLLIQQAENKKIRLLNNVSQDVMAYADTNMLTTVIRNLISNAIKFSPEGAEVDILNHPNGNETILEIKDHGVGMSKEVSSKLFELEHKHQTAGTNNEPGTGLGLLICKEFVEKNNGRIWVESEPGRGSSFFVALPEKEG